MPSEVNRERNEETKEWRNILELKARLSGYRFLGLEFVQFNVIGTDYVE